MSSVHLLVSEIRHRLPGFALGFVAVAAAVALFVAILTAGQASNRETKRLMRNLGFNVLIVPRETDMADYWAADFAKGDMPEEYVSRLAKTERIYADHYVATLEKKVVWRDVEILLTGLLPEQTAVGARKKAPMGYEIPRGACHVGYEIVNSLGIKEGDVLELLGKRLKVEHCLLESGSKEDIRLYVHLRDAQEMLGMPHRINTIQALGCLCEGSTLEALRTQIARVLPDTRVSELRSIAAVRSKTRRMVEQYAGFVMGLALIVCAAWVGLLSLLNVRERRQEIGILRALGFGSGRIAVLFLGRAALMGLVGAALGFVVGTALAMHFGTDIFHLTFSKVRPAYDLLIVSMVAAPLVAALAGLLPATMAVTQDPAVTLTEE